MNRIDKIVYTFITIEAIWLFFVTYLGVVGLIANETVVSQVILQSLTLIFLLICKFIGREE